MMAQLVKDESVVEQDDLVHACTWHTLRVESTLRRVAWPMCPLSARVENGLSQLCPLV